MNILIIGGGGREHALAWKIKSSPFCDRLFVAPGNPGTQQLATNLAVDWKNFELVKSSIIQYKIELVLIGPEEPLVLGLTDYLESHFSATELIVIGPTREGAKLEGSKAFSKEFMQEYEIPTARYASFNADQIAEALIYIQQMNTPIVVKADGLAAGKGVTICATQNEAKEEILSMFDGKFGVSSKTIVLEEFLSGREFSMFVLTDGFKYKILPLAKDYKKIGEGDTGPNTGGMGAISPVPFITDELFDLTIKRVVQPTIQGLKKRKIKYHGFVFIGLIEVKGEPYVIEYNCRMGDPETEVVMPRLKSDLVSHLKALHDGRLEHEVIIFEENAAATVMLVSGGYPGDYKKNKTIALPNTIKDSILFHAGTALNEQGNLITNGGRVMAVTSTDDTIEKALAKSYNAIAEIKFEGMNFRRDIGLV
jgi:phosphoribosylamine--glycine ligase